MAKMAFNTLLAPDMFQALEDYRNRTNRSKASVIDQALREFFERQQDEDHRGSATSPHRPITRK